MAAPIASQVTVRYDIYLEIGQNRLINIFSVSFAPSQIPGIKKEIPFYTNVILVEIEEEWESSELPL